MFSPPLSRVVAATVGGIVLIAAAPFLVLARLLLMLPGVPGPVRNHARLFLLTAVFVAVIEVASPAGVTSRRQGRQAGSDLCAKLTRRLFGRGFAVSGLRLRCPPPPIVGDGPVVVLARHAGAFNSLLTLHLIARDLGRDPQTIAKRCAAVTPGCQRLYAEMGIAVFSFDGKGRIQALRHLRRIALDAQPADALLLFPEGMNYSERRRRAAIATLRADGLDEQARQAEGRRHVMPVHAAGAWMLVKSAPTADVLVLAQTGLEDLVPGAGRIGYPATGSGTVHVQWWHTAADQVPRQHAAFEEWLDERWQAVDSWIGETRRGQGGQTGRDGQDGQDAGTSQTGQIPELSELIASVDAAGSSHRTPAHLSPLHHSPSPPPPHPPAKDHHG